MSNTRPDIDATLQRIQKEVANLGARLFELDAERERRAAEADALGGDTAAAWQQALDQIAVMWAWFQALTETVQSIADRRESPGLDQARIQARRSDIGGLTVAIPAESIEVARRCLPGSTGIALTWTIESLVGFMSNVLGGAAETVASVFVARDLGLTKLNEMAVVLTAGVDRARVAGVRVPNEAGRVQDRLTELRARLGTDPLGVPVDDIGELSEAVAGVRRDIDKAVQEVAGVDEALEQIAASLEGGLALVTMARQDLAEAGRKIAVPNDLPQVAAADDLAGRLTDLQSGLDQARQHLTDDDRTAALRLAAAFGPKAAQLRGDAEMLAEAAGAPLARRRELRGRLDAYRAKAHSLGRAEDAALTDLYQRAQEVLYGAPCDLDEAGRRLAAYQAGILDCATRENNHEL